MEDNSDVFPEQDFQNVLTKIRKAGHSYKNMQEFAIDLIRKLDRSGRGEISVQELVSGLKK